ncbi:HAMP domain-containing sensor histidine kinase [Actinoplanes sp. NPDC051851]|uniref:sensor histidine kinase n=1 Tax=Actinoplanes sp. NPDC051851 TaxID=3154753 RepID=UPI00342C142D
MSFRLRVLLMTMLIAVTATVATGWLTLRQASREFTATVTADQDELASITTGLAEYGSFGTWDGVGTRVSDLSARTEERIRVVTETGGVLADSDLLAGQEARPTTGLPTLVDPRPSLRLPANANAEGLAKTMLVATARYRSALRDAACLTAAGAAVRAEQPLYGVPLSVAADPDHPAAEKCHSAMEPQGKATGAQLLTLVRPCAAMAESAKSDCLQRVFIEQTAAFAPQPVQVYVGAQDEEPPTLPGDSVSVTAAIVAAAAVLCALLLSRRVLRPIAALTRASRGLSEGRLDERVPVRGNDELAELGRTFNAMAESLQRSEERQRRMVADVAHELRTPLVNLRGYLEAMKDGVLPASPELIASLHEEALLQQRVVDDLQDLAMAEAGAMTLHRTEVDLRELAETCRFSHAAHAESSGVALLVDAAGPVLVLGDPDRLRQALGNLIRNALVATPPGGSVTLTVREEPPGGRVSVSDTGTGIAAEDLPHIFDRFWRADPARGRAGGGSGLGLAITRQIVTNHGGTISAASRPGSGTTMTVTLPAIGPLDGGPPNTEPSGR